MNEMGFFFKSVFFFPPVGLMSGQNFPIMTRGFHHYHLMNSLVTFSLKIKQLVGMKWNGMDKCIRIDGVIVLTCALQFKVSDLGSAETLRHKSFFPPLPFEIMAPSFLKECRERIALLPFLVRICSTEPENFFVFDTSSSSFAWPRSNKTTFSLSISAAVTLWDPCSLSAWKERKSLPAAVLNT